VSTSTHDEVANRSKSLEGPARPAGTVTGRALLLGAMGAAVIGLGVPWGTHVLRGSYMALDFSTPAAVVLLFLLVAGPTLLLLRFRKQLALTTAEIVTIYSTFP